MIQNI